MISEHNSAAPGIRILPDSDSCRKIRICSFITIGRDHAETESFILKSPHIFDKGILADGNAAFLHDIIINFRMIANGNSPIFDAIIP